jgi:hypothetical protein
MRQDRQCLYNKKEERNRNAPLQSPVGYFKNETSFEDSYEFPEQQFYHRALRG